MKKKELIFTIVNVGFADEVMEKARKCGVKGGTIIHGRGTAKKDAEQDSAIKACKKLGIINE